MSQRFSNRTGSQIKKIRQQIARSALLIGIKLIKLTGIKLIKLTGIKQFPQAELNPSYRDHLLRKSEPQGCHLTRPDGSKKRRQAESNETAPSRPGPVPGPVQSRSGPDLVSVPVPSSPSPGPVQFRSRSLSRPDPSPISQTTVSPPTIASGRRRPSSRRRRGGGGGAA